MKKKATLGEFVAAYAVVWIALTTMWMQASLAHPAILGLFLGCVLMCLIFVNQPLGSICKWPLVRPTLKNGLLALLLIFPTAFYFAATINQEFPFAGDHDHHMYMAARLVATFQLWLLAVVGSILLCALIAKKWHYVWVLWLVLAIWISTQYPRTEFVLRYPAGLYFIVSPFTYLFWILEQDPLLALRLVNVLSIPVWLLILRPLFLQRWPDAQALILSCVFLFQKEWIYYGTTDFVEPWALVFIFLSLESAVSKNNVWLAPILAGIGCAFKEQAVFALAATAVVALWRSRRTLGFPKSILTAVTIFLPFFVYWSARNRAGVFRTVTMIPLEEAFDIDQMRKLFDHMQDQLGISGWVSFFTLLLGLILAFRYARSHFLLLLCVAGAAAGAELLYLVDKFSSEYIGHARFHLLSWPLLAIGGLLLFEEQKRWRPAILAVASLIVISQSATAARFYSLALQPDYQRNFMEQYHAPLYFPIGKLISQLPPHEGWHLAIANPVDGHWLRNSLASGYGPRLKGFKQVDLIPPSCECRGPKSAILLLDVYQPKVEPRTRITSLLKNEDVKICVERLRQSCSQVKVEEASDGFIAGAIGYSP